jgi:hypothetical protein
VYGFHLEPFRRLFRPSYRIVKKIHPTLRLSIQQHSVRSSVCAYYGAAAVAVRGKALDRSVLRLIDLVGLENMHVCATPVVPILLCGYDELHFMGLCKHVVVSEPTSSHATWHLLCMWRTWIIMWQLVCRVGLAIPVDVYTRPALHHTHGNCHTRCGKRDGVRYMPLVGR